MPRTVLGKRNLTMQLHQLKLVYKKKSRQRVGRGGKRGTYAGRGLKGQKARAGRKPRQGFAGGDTPLSKRLPKQRGKVGKVKIRRGSKSAKFRVKAFVLNLKEIEKKFSAKGGPASGGKAKEVVSQQSLLKKGLIDKIGGRIPQVKILGKGEIKKKLEFKGVKLSKSVQEKIKKSFSK